MQYNLFAIEKIVLGTVVSYVYDKVQGSCFEIFCKDTVFCIICKEITLHLSVMGFLLLGMEIVSLQRKTNDKTLCSVKNNLPFVVCYAALVAS
jgi:hypothetical protein